MIEQFAQWPALVSSSGLTTIHGIESLIEEEANGPGEIHPRRTILIEGRVIVQESQKVNYDKGEATERDLVLFQYLNDL